MSYFTANKIHLPCSQLFSPAKSKPLITAAEAKVLEASPSLATGCWVTPQAAKIPNPKFQDSNMFNLHWDMSWICMDMSCLIDGSWFLTHILHHLSLLVEGLPTSKRVGRDDHPSLAAVKQPVEHVGSKVRDIHQS